MAEYGEWNLKGATLSDITAKKEYGVERKFIIKGINSGKLEYREGSIWGNPYIKVLRRQLEEYIVDQFGSKRLNSAKQSTELRKIRKEISEIKKRLTILQIRKEELEENIRKQ
jgi:hypothetical protein